MKEPTNRNMLQPVPIRTVEPVPTYLTGSSKLVTKHSEQMEKNPQKETQQGHLILNFFKYFAFCLR
jgi:hypothetical protein